MSSVLLSILGGATEIQRAGTLLSMNGDFVYGDFVYGDFAYGDFLYR